MLKQFWLCGMLAIFCVAGLVRGAEQSIEEILAKKPVMPKWSQKEIMLNRRVVDFISIYHYRPGKIDGMRSSFWFNEYFKSLDPARCYFLDSDIEDFRSYETVLGSTDLMSRLEFASKVYGRFLQRLQQWAEFSVACVDQPQDFTTIEYLDTDVKNRSWCKTREELEAFWRLRVKNALLEQELAEEKSKEEKAKNAQNAQEEKAENDAAALKIKLMTPKERLARSYANVYRYYCDLEAQDVLAIFLTSLAMTYDPHSEYKTPEKKEDFDIDMSLSLQGIGATLTSKDMYVTVIAIVPGGPADRDGRLKEGDRIVAVAQDGKEPVDVVDMQLSKVVRLIRGKKNTKVHLTILPKDEETTTTITIVRDEVKLKDAEAESEMREITLEDGKTAKVLVIYLPSFYADFAERSKGNADYKSSSRDVRKLLEDGMKQGGIDGVVLDLRGNGGGSLDDAVALGGLFFKDGPVVQSRSQDGKVRRLYDPDKNVVYEGPLVVMVDKLSASASEIVAADLQDMGRALLVGDKSTHGKGTIQNIFDLDRIMRLGFGRNSPNYTNGNGSLKLTIGKFYRVNGEATQLKGVTPDIIFPSYYDSWDSGEAKLPYVLPWDVISSAKYPEFKEVARLKEQLKAKSAARLSKAADFQEYVADIELYTKFREKKTLPVNKNERKAFNAETEKIGKMFKKFQARRKSSRKKLESKETEVADAHDLILDETLRIMGDYIMLRK